MQKSWPMAADAHRGGGQTAYRLDRVRAFRLCHCEEGSQPDEAISTTLRDYSANDDSRDDSAISPLQIASSGWEPSSQ